MTRLSVCRRIVRAFVNVAAAVGNRLIGEPVPETLRPLIRVEYPDRGFGTDLSSRSTQ